MHRLAIAAALVLLSACATSVRQTASPPPGLTFAERACAGCHAVGRTGESRNPDAPAFRRLARERSDAAIAAAIAAISADGHEEMPPIYVTPDEQRALVAYLRMLRVRT